MDHKENNFTTEKICTLQLPIKDTWIKPTKTLYVHTRIPARRTPMKKKIAEHNIMLML